MSILSRLHWVTEGATWKKMLLHLQINGSSSVITFGMVLFFQTSVLLWSYARYCLLTVSSAQFLIFNIIMSCCSGTLIHGCLCTLLLNTFLQSNIGKEKTLKKISKPQLWQADKWCRQTQHIKFQSVMLFQTKKRPPQNLGWKLYSLIFLLAES